MPYMDPGDAFSSSIEDTLQKRAALQHQTLMDQLAQTREANVSKWHEEEVQQRREEAQARRADLLDRANERDRTDFEKRVSGMLPGDQPDAQMIAQDQKYRTGFFSAAPGAVSTPPAPIAGSTTMPGMVSQGEPGAVQAPPIAAGTPQVPSDAPVGIRMPNEPGPMIYVGNRIDRLKARQDEETKASLAKIGNLEPGTPAFQQAVLQHEMMTGKNVSADFAKTAKSKTRFIFDPVKGTYTDTSGTPVTDLPNDAVIDRKAEPKDQSAAQDREAAHVDLIREHAYTDIKDQVKPIQDQIRRLNKIDTSLNQHTDIADSTLAEQLVTLTAGGAGSGVRISQPMIQQVLDKSRTKWDDFEVALRKWDAASASDKAKPSLFFTDQQKQAMRDLVRAYRAQAAITSKQITDARHTIDNATSVAEINKARTALEETVLSPPEGAAGPTAAPAPFVLPAGVTVTKR